MTTLNSARRAARTPHKGGSYTTAAMQRVVIPVNRAGS